MRLVASVILAIALLAPMAHAHAQKGWGCHAHKEDMTHNEVFTHIHCGPS